MIDLITLLGWKTFMYPKLFPNIKGHVLGICFLYDDVCNITCFFSSLKTFLVKPIFSKYFSNFFVTTLSTEMTKGCTDTLLT